MPIRAIHGRNYPIFERIIGFAIGRPGAADAKNVNFAENEQICRYVYRYPFSKYGNFSTASMHSLFYQDLTFFSKR